MTTIVIDAKLVTSAMVVMIVTTAKIAKNAPCATTVTNVLTVLHVTIAKIAKNAPCAMSVNTLLAPRC